MISVNKMEAFVLVIKAIDKKDTSTASDIMRIIKKSIDVDKKNNKFSSNIDIVDKKDEKVFENAKKRYFTD